MLQMMIKSLLILAFVAGLHPYQERAWGFNCSEIEAKSMVRVRKAPSAAHLQARKQARAQLQAETLWTKIEKALPARVIFESVIFERATNRRNFSETNYEVFGLQQNGNVLLKHIRGTPW